LHLDNQKAEVRSPFLALEYREVYIECRNVGLRELVGVKAGVGVGWLSWAAITLPQEVVIELEHWVQREG
jgi:hypothetical protein